MDQAGGKFCLVKIEAYPDHGPVPFSSLNRVFDQNTRCLSVIPVEVIRPFNGPAVSLEALADFEQSKGYRSGKKELAGKINRERPQDQAHHQALPGFTMPLPAPL